MADIALEPVRIADHGIDTSREQFSGMAFPWKGTVLSVFRPKADEEVLRTSIEMILFTRPGERVMRPEFGSFIKDLLFEPNDDILAITLRATIQEGLASFEPRVTIGPIDIQRDDSRPDTVIIQISISFIRDGDEIQINVDLNVNRETIINAPLSA